MKLPSYNGDSAGQSLADLINSVRSTTRLLDDQGLLCICPAAVTAVVERPWRFYPDKPPECHTTLRSVPSKKAAAKVSQNDTQYCLELWASLHSQSTGVAAHAFYSAR